MKKNKEAFSALLAEWRGKKIAVIGHIRPDGDSLGSQVALCRALNTLGSQAYCVFNDPVPRTLQPFIGDTPSLLADAVGKHSWDVSVTTDCAEVSRIGTKLEKYFPKITLNIDHHATNTYFATHNLVDINTPATAEYLTRLLLDAHIPIDSLAAQALYLGILTDTGQFVFPLTTSKTFQLVAHLVDLGASPTLVGKQLYFSESWERIQLLQRFLNSLRLECDGRVCLGQLKLSDYKETGAERGESEGFVNYTVSLKDVSVGAFLEEEKEVLKVSLRCKDERLQMNTFAQMFGGGGHPCASGFTVNLADHATSFEAHFIEKMALHLDQRK